MMSFTLLLLLASVMMSVTCAAEKKRFWTFTFVRFEECDDVGTDQIRIKFKLDRKSRDVVNLGGASYFDVPMDANVSFHLVADLWGSAGWLPKSYILKEKDACGTVLKHIGACFENLVKASGRSGGNPCPVPVGDYPLIYFNSKEFEYNTNFPAIMPTGLWRVTINFYNENEKQIVGCWRFICDIKGKYKF